MNFKTALAAGLLAIGGTAIAQGDEQDKSFGELDVDRDFQISAEEARADSDVAKQFAALDENGDGYLDTQEFARLERADKNYQ